MSEKTTGIPAQEIKKLGLLPSPPIPTDSLLRTHCYLCAQPHKNLEVEHVVPRVLFKGYDPGHYVKLWSCRECNAAKGLDDEFITRQIQATSFTPEAKAGFEHAVRGFQRGGQGKGMYHELRNRMEKVEARTSGGIILGQVPAFRIDYERFDRFFSNIAKGLFVRNSLTIHDWQEFEVNIQFEQGIQSMDLYHDPLLESIRRDMKYSQYWENIFTYFTDFGHDHSASFLVFYSSYTVVVILSRKGAPTLN